jgi:glycosyltransferase involved in cell wall biosynthesis
MSAAAATGPGRRSRRVLFVVHKTYPLAEPRVRRLAEAAAMAGWRVDVVALRAPGEARLAWLGGVRVLRPRRQVVRAFTLLALLREYGAFWVAVLVHCVKASRYDVVYVANPPDFLVFAAASQRWRGSRIVLDVHDLMTDLFALRSGFADTSVAARVLHRLERASLRYADTLMTVHAPYARELAQRTGRTDAVAVVMNSPDPRFFAREEAVHAGPPVFFFHGSIFARSGVLDLVEAFALARAEIPEAQLWIVGDGDARSQVTDAVQRLQIGDATWLSTGMVPLEEVGRLVARATFGVAPSHSNVHNDKALSGKLLEYVALGVPAICADLPTRKRHFPDDEVLYFAPGSVEELSSKMVWAWRHPDEMQARAAKALRHYKQAYSWPAQLKTFLNVLGDHDGERTATEAGEHAAAQAGEQTVAQAGEQTVAEPGEMH